MSEQEEKSLFNYQNQIVIMESKVESQDILFPEDRYVRAEAGKRFVNYLVDLIVFYVLVIIVGFIIGYMNPSAFDEIDDSSTGFGLLDRLIFLVIYALYMGTFEGLFKGKSLGKMITRTKAVKLDGSPIGWSEAFSRGFSRAVPFCVFSAFGSPCNPWQDSWTSTMVIDEGKSGM